MLTLSGFGVQNQSTQGEIVDLLVTNLEQDKEKAKELLVKSGSLALY